MGALLCIASILSMMVSASLKLEHPQSYNTSFEPRPMTQVMKLIEEATIECMIDGSCPANRPSIRNNPQPCINGMSAGFYPCNNIDLLGYLNLIDLGSSSSALGNDIWGWKDPSDNKLYALSGQTDGSTIVDVTIPTDPDPLVFIPSTLPFHVNWRDMKIFENGNFFIVADSSNHGVQYGNMRTLIDKARDFRATYNHTQIYRAKLYEDVPVNDDVGNVHNVAICEESKTLYVVGSTQGGKSANSQGYVAMFCYN